MVPIIYTEGALRLRDPAFARRLFDLGATVVLKVNSLTNRAYQDAVVRGPATKRSLPRQSYAAGRDQALEVLIKTGFADSTPTRLAFDTIICRQNLDEIEAIHRFARARNIFVLLVNYLPSGRSSDGPFDAISWHEQRDVFARLASIDEREFGIRHAATFPYAGGVPCTIRGLGLYVKIRGEAFDCPGALIPLGDLRTDSLADVWSRVRPITASFDGGCLPRLRLFKRIEERQTNAGESPATQARHLPVFN
jgi:hypothetical protein